MYMEINVNDYGSNMIIRGGVGTGKSHTIKSLILTLFMLKDKGNSIGITIVGMIDEYSDLLETASSKFGIPVYKGDSKVNIQDQIEQGGILLIGGKKEFADFKLTCLRLGRQTVPHFVFIDSPDFLSIKQDINEFLQISSRLNISNVVSIQDDELVSLEKDLINDLLSLFPIQVLFQTKRNTFYEDPNKLLNNMERFELPRGTFIYVNGTVNKIEKRKVIASQKCWENLKDDIAVLSLHDLLITNSEYIE